MDYGQIALLLICFNLPRVHLSFQGKSTYIANLRAHWNVLRFIAFSAIALLIFPWLHPMLCWLPVCLYNARSAVNWCLTEKYNILMFVEFVAKKASCVWDNIQLNSQVIWPGILNCKYIFKIIITVKHTQSQFRVNGKDVPQPKPMLSLWLFTHMNQSDSNIDEEKEAEKVLWSAHILPLLSPKYWHMKEH